MKKIISILTVFSMLLATVLTATVVPFAANASEISAAVAAANPVYYDVLPLSLEEIFIYELGGVNYEVKNIIL